MAAATMDSPYDNEYNRIAVHFFNQFLELKVALDTGQKAKPKNYDKEVRDYEKALAELKAAASDLAARNRELEEALDLADCREQKLRGTVNELTINLGLAQEKLAGLGHVRETFDRVGYKLTELMSDDSRRELEKLLKEIPRP